MSIVGSVGVGNLDEDGCRCQEPVRCSLCEDAHSLISRMLRALGEPVAPVIAARFPSTFGISEGASVAWDPVAEVLVSASGFPHSTEDCGKASRAEGAAAVLEAYRRYGADFPMRLCGESSCAVWDARKRTLILARDALSGYGLFFRSGKGSVVFASDPREILSDSRIPREIDERHMAFFLSRIPLEPGSTFFRSIEEVLPGEMVVFESGTGLGGSKPRRRFWWRPEHTPILRLANHGEYADAVRCELDRAVGCCLPQQVNIGIALSGGLDSTGIAALAARRLAGQNRRLIAATLVFSPDAAEIQDVDGFGDEFPFAALLAKAWPNIDHYRVLPDEIPLIQGIEMANTLLGFPPRYPFGLIPSFSLLKFAGERNIPLWLTGGAGNLTTSYDGAFAASTLLRTGQIGRLAKHLSGLRRNGFDRKSIAIRMLPPAVYGSLRELMGKKAPHLFDFSAINPGLARSTGVLDMVRESIETAPKDSLSFRMAILRASHAGGGREGALRRFRLTPASPTTDRRVAELCFSVPEEQFEWGGRPRALIRTALRGIVPDAILDERRRGRQGLGWETRLQTDFPAIVGEIEAMAASPLANRCLDVPRMRRLCERWAAAPSSPGSGTDEYRTVLAGGLAAGSFLRRFESGADRFPLFETPQWEKTSA